MLKTIAKYSLLILAITLAVNLFGQPNSNIDNLKPKQLLRFGKNYEKVGDIYGAIEYYHRYYMERMEDIEVAHKLAKLYYDSRNYEKAMDYYLKCYVSDPRYIECLYHHAQMLKMNGNYDQALEYFEVFKKRYKGRDLKKAVKNEIESCKIAMQLKKDSLDVEITHLNSTINNAHIEFNPFFLDDKTLVYSSLKEDKVNYYSSDEKKPTRKFYVAKKEGNEWKHKMELEGPFNSDLYDTGNGAFSADGNRFYFSQCKQNWEHKVHCKIYMSKLGEDKKWEAPTEVPNINDPLYTSSYVTVGTDSKKGYDVIYFSSDRPRGKGGYDIWYSVNDTKREVVSKPKNVGSKINTAGDEISPSYSNKDRRLYFSSNGHPGLGGMDIFKAMGEQKSFTDATNLGYPVNSWTDDQYYSVSPDKSYAMFTSNRLGTTPLQSPTCCDDIYSVLYKDLVEIKLDGVVYKTDEDTPDNITKEYIAKNLLKGAVVSCYLISDEFEEPLLAGTDTTDVLGRYEFGLDNKSDYKIVYSKDGFFSERQLFSTKKIDINKDHTAKSVGLKIIPQKAITLANIYYQYDKSNLTKEAKTTIDTTLLLILTEMPDLIVEISAHTDSKGEDNYNMKLSQSRAESVVNYLVSKGIDKKRLRAAGYGESQPIAPNKLPNGKDNPQGRAKNRRTEFKVLGSTDENSIFYLKQ